MEGKQQKKGTDTPRWEKVTVHVKDDLSWKNIYSKLMDIRNMKNTIFTESKYWLGRISTESHQPYLFK